MILNNFFFFWWEIHESQTIVLLELVAHVSSYVYNLSGFLFFVFFFFWGIDDHASLQPLKVPYFT